MDADFVDRDDVWVLQAGRSLSLGVESHDKFLTGEVAVQGAFSRLRYG